MIPDWKLPAGVDRGLHDYMQSVEMVAGYDAMMASSPLAAFDVTYCRRWFPQPGRVLDLGCGTGRLAKSLSPDGFEYVGVDLSEEMLGVARAVWANPSGNDGGTVSPTFLNANIVELPKSLPTFDYAACLFSTLGMIIGEPNRQAVVKKVFGLLRLGGRFVLHVHNRHFGQLGFRGWMSGDLTMPQAYGGAPLTLHHFSKAEAVKLLTAADFHILDVTAIGTFGELKRPWLFPRWRTYGWLIAAERPLDANGQGEPLAIPRAAR
ncbi:MAG: class I SAM-dependent methyltransferase [Fimbriiglobus sp.]|jgi:SAM-dependent methyltransferase|nr:class I SAM-dependent methyltransferase [Fimbriiglobus sp.]